MVTDPTVLTGTKRRSLKIRFALVLEGKTPGVLPTKLTLVDGNEKSLELKFAIVQGASVLVNLAFAFTDTI